MKKRSFPKILLVLMLAAIACLSLAACGEFAFGNYGFENNPPSGNWRDLEYPETDITIDGEGNESIWQNKMATEVKDETGEVTMTTKVHFGEKGVFFLMENDDPWVFCSEDRYVYHNTSMELYVSATNAGLTKDTVQLRFGANGYTEQWIGTGMTDGYSWTRAYVKCMSRIKIYGEMNTADNDGYAIEAYMPYSEIGLEEKPEILYVLTAFCRSNTANSESHRIGWYGGGDINAPATYFPFGENGYIGGEIKDSPVGDFGGFSKTAGWDLSGIADANDPSVSTMAGAEQVIYFKDLEASKYIVSVTIEHDKAINDKAPKAGILAAQNASGMAVAMFDVSASNTKDLFAVRRPAGGGWNWPGANSDGISRYNGSISYSNGVKLTVARWDTDFYYFVNDQFMFSNQNEMFGESNTVAGLITFGCAERFSNFEISDDITEVGDLISSVSHSDSTNKWMWYGDFETEAEDAITLKPGMANVGHGDYIALKSDAVLTGDFELSFSLSNLTHSKVIPNWMSCFLTARLLREDDSEDKFEIRPFIAEDDTHHTTNNPAKKITANFVGANFSSETFDDVNFESNAKHVVKIIRILNGDKADFAVSVDDAKVLEFTSDYVGDYAFGFGNNYAAGEISDIYFGEVRGNAGGYEISETHSGGGTVSLSKTNAKIGEEITVTLAPDEGNKIGAFTVNEKDCYADIVNKVYTFKVTDATVVNVTFVAATARTVTGTVSASDEAVGSIAGASMKVVNAEGETAVTIGANGAYTANLSDGRYKIVITPAANSVFREYKSDITVSESKTVFDCVLNGDPVANGEMTGKEVYYTAARKVTVNNDQGHMDVYVYFGVDGFYVMCDVTDTEIFNTSKGGCWENDNVEISFMAAQDTASLSEGNNIKLLYAVDGRGRFQKNGQDPEISGDEYNRVSSLITRMYKARTGGYCMEFKIDYEIFGMNSAPEYFRIAPAYVDIGKGGFRIAKGVDFGNVSRYIVYSKGGVMPIDEPKDLTLDGDLKDWTQKGLSEDDFFEWAPEGSNGKGFKYQAFKGSDGIYIAVIANYNGFNTNGNDWWLKTNIEFSFNNGFGVGLHLTGDGNNWDVRGENIKSHYRAAVKTTDRGADSGSPRYTTVFEVFVPNGVAQVLHGGGDRFGIAFRPGTEKLTENGQDWWHNPAHHPYQNSKYFIYADGLSETEKA